MSYDYSRNCAIEIAEAILTARKETKSERPEWFTYEEVCTAWEKYRYDRRYKLRLLACTNNSGLVQVGKITYYYSLNGNTCFIRVWNDFDKYEKKPCFQVDLVELYDGCYSFISNYQSDYMI